MSPDLHEFLVANGLLAPGATAVCTPLSGGVSCDVWRIEAESRVICVKHPLARLRVEALWEAPVSRSAQEAAWLGFAAGIMPGCVPRVLANDRERGFIGLQYLDPAHYPVWKDRLLAGHIAPEFASAVARTLARLHTASTDNPAVAKRFDAGHAFFALRIDAYLLEAARRNPAVSEPLRRIADATFAQKIALAHGDVSPKNILVGPQGPVFLDAETAWFGDPAFDLAFCLNHLLLKCLARPSFAPAYLQCFDHFRRDYLAEVTWETVSELERRTAHLLPALLLARVDGKSPVEYLSDQDRRFVRAIACARLSDPPEHLDLLAAGWATALNAA